MNRLRDTYGYRPETSAFSRVALPALARLCGLVRGVGLNILGNMTFDILSLTKTLVPWASGIGLFVAFLLTFWAARAVLIFAAVLWAIGVLSATGWEAYGLFFQGQMAYAFGGGRFPVFAWLVPLISVVLAVVESALLFPWVPQKRALWIGKILFLLVVPAMILVKAFPRVGHPFYLYSLGVSWLAYPLLWFRIREKLNDRSTTPGGT